MIMKKTFLGIISALLPLMAFADGYTVLWQKVGDAKGKDLPKTEIAALRQIAAKAAKEKLYGHLLKAQCMMAVAEISISPDSTEKNVAAMAKHYENAKDPALKAVYAAVLGKIHEEMRADDPTNAPGKSREWYGRAMASPTLLAKHKSQEYEPAVVKGVDSNVFGNDLLHVIGFMAGDYKTLHDYYENAANRAAACICAWKMLSGQASDGYAMTDKKRAAFLHTADSLINAYKDLPEAGLLAIERYKALANDGNAKTEECVSYINHALGKWGSLKQMNYLRNRLDDLQQPMFETVMGKEVALPGKPIKLSINAVRNIKSLSIKVYKVNIDGDTQLSPSLGNDFAKLKRLMAATPSFAVTRSYPGLPTWKTSTDSVEIKGLPVGVYIVEATTDNPKINPQRELLRVSNLFLMRQGLPDKRTRYAVVNATTGAPVKGAHIRLATDYGNKKDVVTLTTDGNGEAIYKTANDRRVRAWAYTQADRAGNEQNARAYYNYWESENRVNKRMKTYTDRAIYRPGQTVHATAIAWTAYRDSLKSKTAAGVQVKFTLSDANRKTVAEKTVRTDGYGTASADFTLPTAGLTGNFRVIASAEGRSSTAAFSVEQYKRPTFQVAFDSYKQAYKAGDTISVRGVATTYSGVPVQNAKVAYTVNRRQGLSWWRRGGARLAAADSVTTAGDGSFTVRVPMTYPEDETLRGAVYYSFDISAKATDAAGETHEATTSLPLSNRTGMLSTDLPEKILKDSLRSITFSHKNLLGEELGDKVAYRFDNGSWHTADSQKPTAVAGLASGKHTLEAVCGTDSLRKDFVVFSYGDKRPAAPTDDWFHISANTFPADGKPVYLQYGSSATGTQVYWAACSGNKVLSSGSRTVSNEVVTRKLQYKEAYGGGITISMAWVADGKLYSHTESIRRTMPDTQLRLSWKTFRDKLTPGQKETWTLTILSPDGKPANAQLLSTLYDKSLDAIKPHRWFLNNTMQPNVPNLTWAGGINGRLSLNGYQSQKTLAEPSPDFSHFDSDMFGWLYAKRFMVGSIVLSGGVRMAKHSQLLAAAAQTTMSSADEAKGSNAKAESAVFDTVESSAPSEEPKGESTQLRENLNETAFFYPALTTDKQGNVRISFTLPESVTTWHFMGLAHDSLMNHGFINADAVASKAIMVQPNMPRFLRDGDKATITTRIFNTTNKDVSGKVRLEFLDPETEKVLATEETTFSVAGNGTATETFDVDPQSLAKASTNQTLFIARIVAEGDGFSDGEQHYLPLLPDKEQVVNTIPFYQNKPGVKNIDLSRLFPADSKDRKLTIEYTNNPAWLVLQALPTIANPNDDNAMSLAAALYANVIGSTVLSSSPKIAQTIKLWQQETGGKASLASNLEKNEELKTMVLDETPWVADANHESDQKKQLAGFLDESTIGYRISTFANKLKKLQNADGSFSWWQGMGGSTHMTAAVVETLARLNDMVGQQPAYAAMLDNAFGFLDKKMAEEVSKLKERQRKGEKNLQPSETACHWLYASALAKRASSADKLYLVNLLDKAPTKLTIYGKAGAAVVLAQYGRMAHAKEYLQSIREYTVYKDEMGRYFDTPKAQYSWFDYRIPTQTFAIEALQRLAPTDTATITEMQRWLLHEKRTTGWSTAINAVNAVYAFMANGKSSFDSSKLEGGAQPTLRLDGKVLELPKATAGIGYVKIAKDADGNARQLTIEKTSNGTSWGAVYGRFMQKASNVGNAASGLKVSREITIADPTDNNQQPTPKQQPANGNAKPTTQSPQRPISVGDKITVRITITADRDYDFVQVQDKRAACLEPTTQLSGYQWGGGYYCAPHDNATNYYFDRLAKGKHVVETTYYVDRAGDYTSGTCTVQCAYAPEFNGRDAAITIKAK